MPKKKFYAIRIDSKRLIVESWAECEKLVSGVSGVRYKSFLHYEDAKNWLSDEKVFSPTGIRIFVDGSFVPDFSYSGWAFVAVDENKELARDSGITETPAESRNIDGELAAAYRAMRWLKENNLQGTICHDYEGIACWANGSWKAKSQVAKRYVENITPYLEGVSFEKVSAHSGIHWNELADTLAKEAIAKARIKIK